MASIEMGMCTSRTPKSNVVQVLYSDPNLISFITLYVDDVQICLNGPANGFHDQKAMTKYIRDSVKEYMNEPTIVFIKQSPFLHI